MTKTFARALIGAFALIAAFQSADAAVLFSNDFTTGIGPQEDVIGNFTVADGYVGHHNGYTNNEYSSYRIILDFAGISNAFLNFDYGINTERAFDNLQVLANDVVLAGYSGTGGGHAHLALDALTQPGIIGRSMISFDFASDFLITDIGARIDNVSITGDLVGSPTGAVPEPASWAMMVAGFGALGATMRHRRSIKPFASIK